MSLLLRNVNILMCSSQHIVHRLSPRWLKTDFYKLISNEVFKVPYSKTKNKTSISVITNYQLFSSKITGKKLLSISSSVEYEQIAEETLQNLCESFEEILEKSNLPDWDVNYSNGVLNITLNHHGSYVLNKQSPNKQIWLSSPISGPKRYDYVDGKWIYKHDGKPLHKILAEEMSEILQKKIDFEDYL